jgi:hypothetical protein
MIRLHIIVEGQTEETFVNEVLVGHLSNFNVFADAKLVAIRRKGAYFSHGSGLSYLKWKNDLLRMMKQDRGDNVWFTTMLDYYALPNDFPGFDACSRLPTPLQAVECLEQNFATDIGHPRFRPYLQLHEFETLLFSDPASFATAYPGESASIARLQRIRDQFTSIEEIDNGPQTAPSQRILAELPRYEKVVAGSLIAMQIGLERMGVESLHFAKWIADLSHLDVPGQV